MMKQDLVKEQEKSVMKKKKKVVLDKAKLLKLLNDEESDLSSDSDEDDINADSSNEGKHGFSWFVFRSFFCYIFFPSKIW